MRTTWARAAVGLALGWVAIGQAAEPLREPARESATQTLATWVEREFKLPDDLVLDVSLRERLEALASAHRKHVAVVAEAWIDEELRRLDLAKDAPLLTRNVLARYINDNVIWQLDSTGLAYDELMLRVVRDPGSCQARNGRWPFGAFAAVLQRMNPADRELALAAQQQMLARWGQARQIAARPVPALLELGQEAMAKLRGPKPVEGEPAVPPVLAYSLLATPQREVDFDVRCALLRWTLSRSALRSTSPEAQMVLARYALLADAASIYPSTREGAMSAAADGYPPVGTLFGVEGDLSVVGRLRPSGKGLDGARIESRKVTVPGVRDPRAVGFETVFDEVTLERAAKMPTRVGNGETVEVPFTWKLK